MIVNCSLILFVEMLENDSVCSLSSKPGSLELIGREEQSAMVIRASRYFQNWTGKQEFNCQFSVSSSLNWGIIVVIQRMSFRRNTQGQCIDFVQVCFFSFVITY
jgi:hypothetical protein